MVQSVGQSSLKMPIISLHELLAQKLAIMAELSDEMPLMSELPMEKSVPKEEKSVPVEEKPVSPVEKPESVLDASELVLAKPSSEPTIIRSESELELLAAD